MEKVEVLTFRKTLNLAPSAFLHWCGGLPFRAQYLSSQKTLLINK